MTWGIGFMAAAVSYVFFRMRAGGSAMVPGVGGAGAAIAAGGVGTAVVV
jgi:hypothetical protein